MANHRALLVTLLGLACLNCNPAAQQPVKLPSLNVYVAASMTDVVDELKGSFPDASIAVTSGPSGLLCTHIENNAPADVIITADRAYIDRLSEKKLVIADSIGSIAGNRLVLAVVGPPHEIKDLSILLDPKITRIAIGNPDHVPAGKYAMQTLRFAGLDTKIREKLVFADDAKMAARYIADDTVDAAIIYESDVGPTGKPFYRIPDAFHGPIEYVAAICTNSSKRDLAAKWMDLLGSSAAQKVLKRRHFTIPGNKPTTATVGP
jgi:molybdate transport system substrate-binding protein